MELECQGTLSARETMPHKINPMLSRRDFLKIAGAGTAVVLLNGCKSTPTPIPTKTPLPGPTPGPTASYTGRNLCFVLWDHQLPRYGYRPRNLKNPVPETCPLYSGATNPVTPEWEAYWRGILHLCNPGMKDDQFEPAWLSLVDSHRAFTNGSGPETGNFALHSLTCGGATHEMVSGEPERQYMRIYTLNSRKDPPAIPATPEEIDMTRHFFATTGSNVKLPDGSYPVYGFPQFDNCIVPLVSRADTDMIELSRIKVVDGLQKPYNP
jgi:hypothetical protein